MKKLFIVGLLAGLVFVGCDLFPNLTFDDIKGEWDFPDTTFNSETITAIHISLMPPAEGTSEYRVDLSWNNFNNFYYGDGSMEKNVFTGTYNVGGSDPTSYSITISFSLNNKKLKAVFSGEGPLNGLILEQGTQST